MLRVPLVVRGAAVRVEGLAFADGPGEVGRVLGPERLRIEGADVEVDGCEFFGTRGIAVTVTGQARNPRVRGCYFHDPLGDPDSANNAAVQVGQSMRDTNTRIGALIEDNLFERWAIGSETVSVKSSGNAVRGNLLADCRNLTNRHGEGNLYEGNTLERSGWVTVFDRGTRVLRNQVTGGRGVRVIAGDISCDAVVQGGQPQACDTFLEGNAGLLVVGFRFGRDPLPAEDTTVANHEGPVELRLQRRTRLPGVTA